MIGLSSMCRCAARKRRECLTFEFIHGTMERLRGREAYLRIAILGLTREAPGEGGDESTGFLPGWHSARIAGTPERHKRQVQTWEGM